MAMESMEDIGKRETLAIRLLVENCLAIQEYFKERSFVPDESSSLEFKTVRVYTPRRTGKTHAAAHVGATMFSNPHFFATTENQAMIFADSFAISKKRCHSLSQLHRLSGLRGSPRPDILVVDEASHCSFDQMAMLDEYARTLRDDLKVILLVG